MTSTLLPSLFDIKKFDPFMVGYDKFFADLEDLAKTASKSVSYPPYNIKAVGKDKYVIEMAVAGFAKTDIEISLQGNKLVVEGSTQEEDKNELFITIKKIEANTTNVRKKNIELHKDNETIKVKLQETEAKLQQIVIRIDKNSGS
mgnify:CR=1 FL=1